MSHGANQAIDLAEGAADRTRPKLMTFEALAAHLSIPRDVLRALVKRREIPFLRIGPRLVMFATADVTDWLEGKRIGTRLPPAALKHLDQAELESLAGTAMRVLNPEAFARVMCALFVRLRDIAKADPCEAGKLTAELYGEIARCQSEAPQTFEALR